MTLSKITLLGAAIVFLSLNNIAKAQETNNSDAAQKETKRTAAEQKDIDAVVGQFKDLKPCDGSERAEFICKANCTGEGYLWGVGTCSHQEIWSKCAAHCRPDWIKDCSETATNKKNNLKGIAQCTK